MIRKLIRIDKEKCNGCGACADACHEGAIDIINGKAELVREHFCDGLGDCLPECPTEAISFEEREAPAYDEEAVKEAQKKVFVKKQAMSTHTGCPKLDQGDYSEKLTAIIQNNNIQSVTIVRMEVPCCGGLEIAAKKALQDSGKFLPWQVITISIDGKTIE